MPDRLSKFSPCVSNRRGVRWSYTRTQHICVQSLLDPFRLSVGKRTFKTYHGVCLGLERRVIRTEMGSVIGCKVSLEGYVR